jgi:hypothetical protein
MHHNLGNALPGRLSVVDQNQNQLPIPFGIMPGRAAAAKNYACSQLVLMGSQALQRV